MASVFFSTRLDVAAGVAWDFVDRYTRAEVHVFSVCASERLEGDTRIVTLSDGTEILERNVTVDPARMRAVYTVPGLPGIEHHQAEMRVVEEPDRTVVLEWCTDVLPHGYAEALLNAYAPMFDELVAAVNGHVPG